MKPGSFSTVLTLLGSFWILILSMMHASESTDETPNEDRVMQAVAPVLKASPEHVRIEPGPAALATGDWKAFRAISHAGTTKSVVIQGFVSADTTQPVVLTQSPEALRHFLKKLDIARPSKTLPVEDLVSRMVWLYPHLGEPIKDP